LLRAIGNPFDGIAGGVGRVRETPPSTPGKLTAPAANPKSPASSDEVTTMGHRPRGITRACNRPTTATLGIHHRRTIRTRGVFIPRSDAQTRPNTDRARRFPNRDDTATRHVAHSIGSPERHNSGMSACSVVGAVTQRGARAPVINHCTRTTSPASKGCKTART